MQQKKLRKDITQRAIIKKGEKLEDISELSTPRTRVIGSEGHKGTVQWLLDSLKKYDDFYDVYTQDFNVTTSDGDVFIDGTELPSQVMTFTGEGNPTAPIVVVNNLGCVAEDFPAEVAGNVALIQRGECAFGVKAANAKAAGAAGTLIYNNVEGVVAGTLGGPGDYAPTIGISQADGLALTEAIAAGTEKVATLNVVLDITTTTNVIAETKQGDKNNVIFAGAHSDSVEAGPGINDNGSGSIGILEVAEQLTKYKVNNAVRFAWWSAEEAGLLGAADYVSRLSQEELDKIRIYLNFDMIASPNYVYAIYDGDGSAFGVTGPVGSAQAEKLFEDYFASQGLATVPSDFDGRSDYGPFLEAGVACAGLFTGAEGIKTEEEAAAVGGQAGVAYDINYHAVGDDFTNCNITAWFENTKAIAHSVATLAVSTDILDVENPTKRANAADTYAPKHAGCMLVV